MGTMTKNRWMKRAAAMSLLPMTALGVVGCSTSGTEEGADVEDVVDEEVDAGDPAAETGPYDGVYDSAFYDEMDSYVGEEVTLSADVNEVMSPMSFTIAGTDDTTVEALLVVHDKEMPEVKPELTVSVTGIVHEAFDLPTVEEEMGIDLDDEAFEDWDGEPYVEATSVDTSVVADS
ncbi:hypothetical protein [Arthrobacter zhaoguopingii]|uniref:hypothetical protein n=1 Tax=Arthrobacter zhaoguopingii TaxID=2681491 RepID=UPI00135AE041|nr:hypothetical protein [Arthrobacter zhaoguopingii]